MVVSGSVSRSSFRLLAGWLVSLLGGRSVGGGMVSSLSLRLLVGWSVSLLGVRLFSRWVVGQSFVSQVAGWLVGHFIGQSVVRSFSWCWVSLLVLVQVVDWSAV